MKSLVRLQLSRRKGFSLHDLSLATNGLPVVTVARPTRWGNPWTVAEILEVWEEAELPTLLGARAAAVHSFKAWLAGDLVCQGGYPASNQLREEMLRDLHLLRGHNLACWCHVNGGPCHADVLLELANS